MNKSLLAAFALASVLSACSSHPSDHGPAHKTSVDKVAPGTRETDIYNLNGQEETMHDAHGHNAGHTTEAHEENVMMNHDEHATPLNGEHEMPAEEKTTNAGHVENHE